MMLRIVIGVLALGVGVAGPLAAQGNQRAAAALTGRVSSDTEGPMEGVLVRAKGIGRTVSVTVVTDRNGEYSFPAARLTPQTYNLDIRAVGYELANPVSVEVAPAKRLARTSNLRRRMTSVPNLRAPNGCSASQGRRNKRASYFDARPATPLPRSFKARMTRRDG